MVQLHLDHFTRIVHTLGDTFRLPGGPKFLFHTISDSNARDTQKVFVP